MPKTKFISPIEYSKVVKKSIQNTTKHLRKGNLLEGVISVKKYSRFYTLEVPVDFS